MSSAPPDRTALYRLFDNAERLLYVGITNNTELRWSQHARDKPWWPDVTRKTVEWLPTRGEAVLAEAKAITEENPRWNISRPDEHGKYRLPPNKSPGRPKTGKTPMQSFRISDEVWGRAKAKASIEGLTMTEVLLREIHRYVSTPPKPPKPPAEPDGP